MFIIYYFLPTCYSTNNIQNVAQNSITMDISYAYIYTILITGCAQTKNS